MPGKAYNYGTLLIFASPKSKFGGVQVYIPDTSSPRILVRVRYNAAWKAWASITSAGI